MHDNRKRPPCYSCEPFHAKLHRLHHQFHQQHQDRFQQHYRYFRYIRPVIVVFNLVILYLLFTWIGFKGLGIFFACLIGLKEIFHFFYLLHFEKRILKPIDALRHGVDEIAKGNYTVQLAYAGPNDLGLLIASFNEMAQALHQNEKLKAEYEENRKNLLANISHDLKTPITAIQGYIEALMDKSLQPPDSKEKYLQVIYQNTVYINKLIDDLFLFSKLDMQKLDFDFEPAPIIKVMADIMEEYKFDFADKKISCHYTVTITGSPLVNLDRKRFFQAFNNLISNAVKHGPDQHLALQVQMYRQEDFIHISLQDNGPGIPADKLPYIFNRFYRVETERPKDFTSTGLGLAIAQELIEAHGGKISVASSEGQGTCFTIILPVWHNEGGIFI